MSEWISVKDRLPLEEEHVLLYDEIEGICVGYKLSDCFNHHPMGDFASGVSLFKVTHWTRLPKPPCNDKEWEKFVQKRLQTLLVYSPSKYGLFHTEKIKNSWPPKD